VIAYILILMFLSGIEEDDNFLKEIICNFPEHIIYYLLLIITCI